MRFLSLFFAYRFFKSSTHERSISSMMLVCFLALMIGSFSLTLVLAIMNGFEQETHKKLQGIHSDIIVRAHGKSLAYEKIRSVLKQEFADVIAEITPYAFGHVLVQFGKEADISHPVTLIAINPETESLVTTLEQSLVNRQKKLDEILHGNQILIGSPLAQELGVKEGDQVDLLYVPEGVQKKTITFATTTTDIGGLFKTGIDDIDTHAIFCSLGFFNNLFSEEGITQIGIKLRPQIPEEKTITLLKDRLHLPVFSWKDLYQPLVSALLLEKYAMFLIILLVCLVACMNSISLLFMIIAQKQIDIALLRVMGMSQSSIIRIFLVLGFLITSSAASFGIFLAWLAALLLEKYPFIKLPDVYYVDHLPAHLTVEHSIIVFGLVCVISFIATVVPIWRIKKLSITHILKFEA